MNLETKRAFKRELFEQFARVGKALSSGPRLELLELLSQTERTVEQLAGETGLSFANVSQHMQVLRRARMVEVRRDGLHAFYRLADENVFRIWQAVRTLGEARFLEIREVVNTYLHDRESLEAITAEELARRMEEGSVLVLDVRPTQEYVAGHISGAISIPVAELGGRLKELPRSTEIVAYCRGPYCVQSDSAVALLSRNGFKVKRLEIGLPDWRANGLPVERMTAATTTTNRISRTQKPSNTQEDNMNMNQSKLAKRNIRRLLVAGTAAALVGLAAISCNAAPTDQFSEPSSAATTAQTNQSEQLPALPSDPWQPACNALAFRPVKRWNWHGIAICG